MPSAISWMKGTPFSLNQRLSNLHIVNKHIEISLKAKEVFQGKLLFARISIPSSVCSPTLDFNVFMHVARIHLPLNGKAYVSANSLEACIFKPTDKSKFEVDICGSSG